MRNATEQMAVFRHTSDGREEGDGVGDTPVMEGKKGDSVGESCHVLRETWETEK